MGNKTFKFAGVLFDMDGTLVDTEPLWHAAEKSLMDDFNTPWTAADNNFCVGGPPERVTNYMADLVRETGQPRPEPEAIMDGFMRFMRDEITNEPLKLQAGASDLLQEVSDSGLPSALVSSSPRLLMDAVLAQLGSHWFDYTLAGDEVEQLKPSPFPYLQAAAAIGVDPDWCVVIEDSAPGVESGEASGAFVVALQHSVAFNSTVRRVAVPSLSGVSLADFNDWFTPPAAAPVD